MALLDFDDVDRLTVQFKPLSSSEFRRMTDAIEKYYIETKYGSVYEGMQLEWEQGRTRSPIWDNYFFTDGTNRVYPEDVQAFAIQED